MTDHRENMSDDRAVAQAARREFMKKCGKFAVVVPPTMALLLTRHANAAGVVGSPGGLGDPIGDPGGGFGDPGGGFGDP